MVASPAVTFQIRAGGETIHTLEDWFRLAPPAGGLRQWKDGRSAKEFARRWLNGYPSEVREALDSHPHLEGFEPDLVEPEYETRLDEFPRARNHDAVVQGKANDRDVLVCIEAKADEKFDDLISERLDSASSGSNFPERVRRLADGLFGRDVSDPAVTGLRYQLVQACAATVIEAANRGLETAVFLIHEFVTDETQDELLRHNSEDLNRFVRVLTKGKHLLVSPNGVLGPVSIPGYRNVPSTDSLFLGKATAFLRTG